MNAEGQSMLLLMGNDQKGVTADLPSSKSHRWECGIQKKQKEGKADIKEDTCAETKAYLILLEKVLQLVLKYATAGSEFLQHNAENKFPSPPFTGGNKKAQSSKWLSKPGAGRLVQEATSAPGAPSTHVDTMDPTEQKPSQRFTLLLWCRLAEKWHSGELWLS